VLFLICWLTGYPMGWAIGGIFIIACLMGLSYELRQERDKRHKEILDAIRERNRGES
jgi:hypothetical protein